MSRLTGEGEQRRAEVIDDQGDTVPLPVIPSADDPREPSGHRQMQILKLTSRLLKKDP